MITVDVLSVSDAIAGWEETRARFAVMQASAGEYVEATRAMRAAGFDPETGLTTIPAHAVRFTDRMAVGGRVRAMCSGHGDETWLLCDDGAHVYPAGATVQVKAGRV